MLLDIIILLQLNAWRSIETGPVVSLTTEQAQKTNEARAVAGTFQLVTGEQHPMFNNLTVAQAELILQR